MSSDTDIDLTEEIFDGDGDNENNREVDFELSDVRGLDNVLYKQIISSENLSPEERKAALSLSRSLSAAKELMRKGEKDSVKIREAIVAGISSEPLVKIDYAEIVDSADLSPVEKIEKPVLAAAAVYFGKTRLIDNFTFEGDTK